MEFFPFPLSSSYAVAMLESFTTCLTLPNKKMSRLETPSIERREKENGLVYICCLRFVFTLYSLNLSFVNKEEN
jgi:hypothetical protein